MLMCMITFTKHIFTQAYNTVECYKSNDSFDKFQCCFDIVADVDGD